MNWEAVQAMAEVVGAGGVIASLLYLAMQVRQNTRSMRSAANQDLLTAFNQTLEFAKSGEYGARIYDGLTRGGLEHLSTHERLGARLTLVQMIRVFEQAHLQQRAGLLDEDVWRGWENNMRILTLVPGFRVGWGSMKAFLSPGFVSMVESLAEQGGDPLADYLHGWGMPKPDESDGSDDAEEDA